MDRLQENMLRIGSQLSDKFAVELYPKTKEALEGFPLKGDAGFDDQAVADAAAFAVLQALTTLTERTVRTGLSPHEANVATLLAFKTATGIFEAFSDSLFHNCLALMKMSRAEQEMVCQIAVETYGKQG